MNYPARYWPVFGAALPLLFIVISVTCPRAVQGEENIPESGGKKPCMILTADDNGKNIKVAVDGSFRVDLVFQGGTGYNWYPDDLNEKLIKLIDIKTEAVADKKTTGSSMTGMWYFKALAPGDTDLKMLYYRDWEGKKSAQRSFTVRLRIDKI